MVILCTSCGTALPTVKPYKLDVQQGNVVTSKMLLQLRPGMTKSQVRFIMGTPLIQDSFHGNRWDYAYQMREGGKVTEQRRVILDFENELLKIVRGDVIPSSAEVAKPIDDGVVRGIKPNASPEEKGLKDKLNLKGNEDVKPLKAAAAASVPPNNSKPDDVKPKSDVVPQVTANAVPVVEEVKSVLAIPVEVMLVSEPVAPVKIQNPVEVKVERSAELVQTKEPLPIKIPFYESPSGMLFDRTLKFAPEAVEPETKPVVAAPRAGNKIQPKPKDLPVEGSSGFFDRMLEKIGF